MYCPFILFFIPSLSTYSKTILHDATKETYSLSECNIGGPLAAAKETNGGFYLSPSVGAQVKLTQN